VSWQLLSPVLIVGGALVIIALERAFPYDGRQKLLRRGLFTDLVLYGIVQSYALAWVIGALVKALDGATGLSRLRLVSGWPLLAQLAFFFVTHDLYIYWFHRWQHSNRVLWRIHEAHHAVNDVDWIAGARSHALEILVNQTVEYAPLVLLGAHPDVLLMKGALDAVWGMWIHSNVDVRTGWLQKIVNGPEMHRWHHSSDSADGEMNFGTKIALWDWLFGTAFLPRGRKPRGSGLWDGAPFPDGFLAQQLYAFRPFGAAVTLSSPGVRHG
jgi:sterol desaturase/sphingolipid hydroxylase (fatty acid hydroxylase superfamily)